MSADAVIGREEELGEIRASLTACADGPASLALAGEPGIGKTVLWEAGVADARQRGYRVLAHRSVQAEAGFAFAGLTDLVAPVFEEAAEELAAPRRTALEAALLLGDPDGAPPDPQAIAMALLDLLRALARDAPVLVALDDVQWLDPASASVLPATLRRLDGERVGLLATARGTPAALRAWQPTGLRVRLLEPLGIGALQDRGAPAGRRARQPTEALVAAAHGDPETARRALEMAGDVLVSDDGRLRFAHPLLASLCYDRATPSRRRDAHCRLAGVVTDGEERARHLALATTEPDAAVATALEAASARATARGAAVAAAELAELAGDRTPPGDIGDLHRRRLAAGRLQWLAGDLERAAAIYDELVASMPPGPDRAELLYVMALSGGRRFTERAALCEQGIAEAGDDARTIELYAQLGLYRWFTGDTLAGLADTREGLRRAERLGDPRLRAIAQSHVGYLETWSLDFTPGLLERGAEAEAAIDPPLPFYQSPRASLAAQLVYRGEPARGRAILLEYLRAADEGAEHTRGFVLFFMPLAEWLLGRWDDARYYAGLVREYTAQAHDPDYRAFSCFLSGLVEGDRGSLDAARAYADEALRNAITVGDLPYTIGSEALLGHIELVAGNVEAAAQRLRPLPDRMLRSGHRQGILVTAWPDTIEALVMIGELDEASERLAQYEEIAPSTRGSHLVSVARARGQLLAARGETTAAEATLRAAVTTDAARTFPYERARALLALGAAQRRAQQRRAARETLTHALGGFAALDAAPWVTRARDELRRVSGRRPADDGLTEAERRVAALAADGLRNKEIAGRLVIDVRTVETHLSRAYRKLGVRSRSELASRFSKV